MKARRARRSVFGRVFASLILLLLVAIGAASLAAFYAYNEFTAAGPLQANKIYVIAPKQSQQEIGAALEREGIVSSGALFAGAAHVNSFRGQVLKPGEYEFPASASMEQVMAIIASGKAITYKITIPEGWTSEMALARVNENDVLQGDAVTTIPAEGTVRPDTYVFRRGMTRQKLVEDMQAAQAKLVAELWEERPEAFALKSREELVTLASIVEKETGVADERQVVASVFLNRLKQGMRLQSDPTIIYGLVAGKGKLDRALTKDDIASDTPYNTYRIAGLPPGPIANPGKASLEAVLNPAQTNYVYFVANGTGGHAFAETLAEHNANVAKWRSIASGTAAVVATDAAPVTAEPDAATAVPAVPPDAPAETAQQPTAETPQQAAPGAPQVPADTAEGAVAQPIPPPEATVPADSAVAATEPVPAAPKPTAPAPVASTTVLEPGTLIKVADRLVPVPRQKPKR